MKDGPIKRLNQSRLEARRWKYTRSLFKVGYYKRLMFSEAMRQSQIANVVYLEQAGLVRETKKTTLI